MNLIDTFKISKKDIITIVGAGGKTSLMHSASSLLRKDYKVLITTTTHIYIPDDRFYDEIFMISDFTNEKYNSIIKSRKNGVYVIGNYIVNNSKIKGLTPEMLDEIIPYFDIVIIEGDGSKEKCLKGWNDNEPVIYQKTTKIIGVVDITSIGININEENIHRLNRFLEIINEDAPEIVKLNHLKDVVLNRNGLFKTFKKDKILFINKVENTKNQKDATNLIENIKNENPTYIENFIYGSIFKNKFVKG